MKQLYKLLQMLKESKNKMALSFLFLLLSTGFTLIQPKFIEFSIDEGIKKNDLNAVIFYSVGIFVLAVIGGILNFGSGFFLINSAYKHSYNLRNKLYEKIIFFSFRNIEKWRIGELMVRMNSDINTVRMFIQMGLMMLIQSLLMIFGSIIIMFFTNIKLASIMAVLLPFLVFIFFILAYFMRPLFLKLKKKQDNLNNTLQENLAGTEVVKTFARQDFENDKYQEKNKDFLKTALKSGYIMAFFMPFFFLISQISVVVVMWLGGSDVIYNILNHINTGLTIGQLVAFNNYAMMSMFPVMMLGMVLNFASTASASAARLVEVLEEDVDIKEDSDSIVLKKINKPIVFKNVNFRYGHGENCLSNINLEIFPGEKVGIVGGTGSGKSTLASLLGRFYDINDGEILINGIDIKKYSTISLRKRISIVLQESVLFSGTIADNIRFGNPNADEALVKKMADVACATEFISKKENGFNEIIGERGSGLSGGQKQRIAVARTIIADNDLIILDDVTSSLDLSTEKKMSENLTKTLRDKTILIISQKILTVKKCDKIIVLDKGMILDIGTHEELLKRCLVYQDIYKTQSSSL